jgi:NADH-ubiquinone oxidoreductase chain 4
LPRAHAEAPVGGSIVLAGLVLKLATYGYIRLLLIIIPEASSY